MSGTDRGQQTSPTMVPVLAIILVISAYVFSKVIPEAGAVSNADAFTWVLFWIVAFLVIGLTGYGIRFAIEKYEQKRGDSSD